MINVKKGISLIVLVITIIVIVILAGAVILSLSQNSPINSASEASYKASVNEYNSELSLTLAKKYSEITLFNPKGVFASSWDGVSSTTGTVKEYIPSISAEEAANYIIQRGSLIYTGSDSNKKTWSSSLGYSDPFVKNGLVLWLEGSDFTNSPQTNSWIDRSKTGNNFTPNTFSYTSDSGSDGFSGVQFDGINDIASITTPINLGTQWTVDVKLYYNNRNKAYEFFIGSLDSNGSIGKIMLNHGGYVCYSFPASTYYNFNYASSLIDNKVSGVVFVSNGTDVKLYVNGINVDTKVVANAPLAVTTIGNAWSDNVWLAKFKLFNIKFYNRALTPAEILQNYNANN